VACLPTPLVEEWLDRLATTTEVDLNADVAADEPLMADLLSPYTPRGFALRPLEGSYLLVKDGGVRLDLTALLVPPGADPDGPGLGVVERHFDTSGGWARHSRLELPADWQGRGLGRAMMRETALLYDGLGIGEVTLTAVDYGRYVWAMCGFDYRDPGDRASILIAVNEFADELGLSLGDLADVEHPWEIGFFEGTRPLTMGEIADARGEDVEELAGGADRLDETVLAGKALLLYSDYTGYEGVLRLGDEQETAGRDQLLAYTGT
jgi:GNAT superfamily N-acetyltransferase